jgi:hypothetical protein
MMAWSKRFNQRPDTYARPLSVNFTPAGTPGGILAIEIATTRRLGTRSV